MPDRTCSFDGCDKPHYGLGLCRGHWKQKRRTGKLAPLRSYQFDLSLTATGIATPDPFKEADRG